MTDFSRRIMMIVIEAKFQEKFSLGKAPTVNQKKKNSKFRDKDKYRSTNRN